MSKISLTDLANLQNETTAVNAINDNNAILETAFDNTLSRDGTTPNTMGANLDMNNNQILNLPAPSGAASPVRLQDVVSPATIASVPPVGTSGAVVGLLNANNTHSGNNSFTGANTFNTIDVNSIVGHTSIEGVIATGATGSGLLVYGTSPTLTTPNLGTPSAVILTNATSIPMAQATGNLTVSHLNSGTSASSTTFWRGDGTWTAPVLSSITAALGSDVALSNTSNYFDGPTIVQGSTGTWFVSGTVTLQDTSGNAQYYVKLWDGTTVIATCIVQSVGAGSINTGSLSGIITAPAGNLRLSCRDATTTAGKIIFNGTGLSKDSTITAIRIA